MKTKNLSFSIIIPTWNRKKLLQECINSVIQMTDVEREFEIIICDSFSEDGTQDDLEKLLKDKYYSNLKVFQLNDNNICKKRNHGIKKSSYENILLLDDDCVFIDNVLKNYEQYLTQFDDKYIFCGKYKTNSSLLRNSNYYRYRDFKNYNLNDSHPTKIDKNLKHINFYNIVTGNMAFKKSMILKKNIFFDERIFGNAFEDAEWGYRIMENNLNIIQTDIEVLHNETSRNIINYKKKWYFAAKDVVPQIIVYNFNAAKKLPVYIFEERNKGALISFLMVIFFILIKLKIFKLIDYFLQKTDKYSIFYSKFLFRLSIYSAYVQGKMDRDEKLLSSDDTKKGWYKKGYK